MLGSMQSTWRRECQKVGGEHTSQALRLCFQMQRPCAALAWDMLPWLKQFPCLSLVLGQPIYSFELLKIYLQASGLKLLSYFISSILQFTRISPAFSLWSSLGTLEGRKEKDQPSVRGKLILGEGTKDFPARSHG